jgi:caffeoyl-CoA O-methyltransferase
MLTLVSERIDEYAVAHTSPLPPLLAELQATTWERMGRRAAMMSGHVEGTLLQMLVGLVGARRVLELGTFTGFSALMMAAALPDEGKLITCDVDPETSAVARSFFDRSPHGRKIEIRLGPALETVKALAGPFEVIFIDADKPSYPAYYEATLPLLAPRGVMAVDNVLRGGRVVDPHDEGDRQVAAFNDLVQRDPRVTNVMLTVRDGITLIRRRSE